jgi:tRNA1(Val) A37 N6-methylase TrmN6
MVSRNTKALYHKRLGAFYTPAKVAEFLVKWAVRDSKDIVLDPGTGEGIFFKYVLQYLIELGSTPIEALNHVYGVEIDSSSFLKLKQSIIELYGFEPKLLNVDFFDVEPGKDIPLVDAVVGNPPYIRRQLMNNLEKIRSRVLSKIPGIEKLSNLADIYCYFILYASTFLKPGGRLAIIVSSSWLNMDYGEEIKRFLKRFFRIKAIIGFEQRVFPDALVNTVLLMAEKIEKPEDAKNNIVLFMRLKNLSELDKVSRLLTQGKDSESLKMIMIPQDEIRANEQWGLYLYMPRIYFRLIHSPLIVPLRSLAKVKIGLQTLRKDFFILSEDEVRRRGIELMYLERIAVSPRDTPLVINSKESVRHFVIYCNKPKGDLVGTNLLKYIEKAEKMPVAIRGKKEVVVGLHNVPRIKQASREPWYNLLQEIDEERRAPILIPRRIYSKFYVVWNKAGVVVNEDFICVTPLSSNFTVPLLAILNSSIMELLIRLKAHLYGGGVYDLRPDDVRELPVIDVSKLNEEELKCLANAYEEFVRLNGDKAKLDECVIRILGLTRKDLEEVYEELKELKMLSSKFSNY